MSWQWAISSSLFHRTEFARYFIVSWLSCHVSLFIIHRTGSNPPQPPETASTNTHTLDIAAELWWISSWKPWTAPQLDRGLLAPPSRRRFSLPLWNSGTSTWLLNLCILWQKHACLAFRSPNYRRVWFAFTFSPCVLCLLPKTWSDDDVCMLSFLVCTTQERFGDEERKTCALLYCDDDDDKHRMSRRCGGLSHSMISNEKSEMWWLTNSKFHNCFSLSCFTNDPRDLMLFAVFAICVHNNCVQQG